MKMPKLREYKGVTYRGGEWIDADSVKWTTATDCLYHNSAPRSYKESKQVDLTDADHAALMDLKNNPYEPNPTLEDVVEEWNEAEWVRQSESEYALQELCTYIREAFPDIDKPFSDTLGEKTMVAEYNTVQDHVDALVRMGAKYYSGDHPYMEGYPRLVLPKVK
jgi:hypothetical protein